MVWYLVKHRTTLPWPDPEEVGWDGWTAFILIRILWAGCWAFVVHEESLVSRSSERPSAFQDWYLSPAVRIVYSAHCCPVDGSRSRTEVGQELQEVLYPKQWTLFWESISACLSLTVIWISTFTQWYSVIPLNRGFQHVLRVPDTVRRE
jgi:hypothetical protein